MMVLCDDLQTSFPLCFIPSFSLISSQLRTGGAVCNVPKSASLSEALLR